jgi:hypothetical protein
VKATLSPQKWDRWRRNPCDFVEEVLHDPETGKPFQLLDVERRFMERAFETDADGRMTYPELLYGAPRKSGKTAFGALFMLTMVQLYRGFLTCGSSGWSQPLGTTARPKQINRQPR